jgi:hypothetical protein
VSVQQVSEIIAKISEAAAEQTRAIGQINGAVGSLEQMTQQNAALVEQSAAAAAMLKDQATLLDAIVHHFSLADAAESASACAPVTLKTDDSGLSAPPADWTALAKAS